MTCQPHVCVCVCDYVCVQDDVFENAIVDFFETADTNKDGVLSYDDFCAVSRNHKFECWYVHNAHHHLKLSGS